MDNEELKKKVIKVLRDNCEYELRYYSDDNYTEVVIDYEAIADALIAEGLGFSKSHDLTLTFNHMQQARIDYLECRAAVAERALEYAVSEYRCDECPNIECNAEIRGSLECIKLICAEYKKEAERDIAEENK